MALQVASLEEWTTLLTSGGIPSASAETYAAKFVENRLTNLDLPDLDETILTSLDITILGDQLDILRLAKRSSNTVASQQADSPSNEQPHVDTRTHLHLHLLNSQPLHQI